MQTPESVALLAAPVLVAAVAALYDLRTRRIPNWLTLGAMLGALGFAAASGGLLVAGLGLLTGGLPALVPSRRVQVGGGDMKLLAALGAMLGPVTVFGVTLVVTGILILLPPRIERPMAPIILAALVPLIIVRLAC